MPGNAKKTTTNQTPTIKRVNRGNINSVKDIKPEWDYQDTVTFRNKIKTTVGRVIFNSVLPAGYPFVNEPVNKKKLYTILQDIFTKYPKDKYLKCVDQLKRLGFKVYTTHPCSFPIDNLTLPPELEKKKNQLLKIDDPKEFDKQLQSLITDLQKYLDQYGYDVADIVESGGRGSWKQLAQILIAKGIVIDPKGNVLPPIKSSFAAGLQPVEHFHQGAGARSGIIDRALSTAPIGYLTRKLVLATQSVTLGKTQNCKTRRFLTLKVTDELASHLVGRYTSSGELITEKNKSKFVGKVVQLRSPIYCKNPEICRMCYGQLANIIDTDYIGIVAAQTVGERGLQVTMQTFHTGGVVSFQLADVFEQISQNNPNIDIKLVKKYIKQDENKILSGQSVPFRIILNKKDYEIQGSLDIDKESQLIYCTSSVIMTIEPMVAKGQPLQDLVIVCPAQFSIPFTEETATEYIFEIEDPNTEIFELRQSTDSFSQGLTSIIHLLNAKYPFKTTEQLLLAFWSKYKEKAADVDLVHFEVIVSNILRDADVPYIPARLNPKQWNPKQYPIKEIPFLDGKSWLLGLAFENAGKAIDTGLVTSSQFYQSKATAKQSKATTPIERILLGEI